MSRKQYDREGNLIAVDARGGDMYTCTNCKQKDCPCFTAAKHSEAQPEGLTVSVGALRELLERWRTDSSANSGDFYLAQENCADELAALIAEAANAPSAGSIGEEA